MQNHAAQHAMKPFHALLTSLKKNPNVKMKIRMLLSNDEFEEIENFTTIDVRSQLSRFYFYHGFTFYTAEGGFQRLIPRQQINRSTKGGGVARTLEPIILRDWSPEAQTIPMAIFSNFKNIDSNFVFGSPEPTKIRPGDLEPEIP